MKERYHISGMTCSACSAHVEKAANKLKGVEKASVNLLTETMEITYDEQQLGESEIVKAVVDAGYGASRIESARGAGSTSGDLRATGGVSGAGGGKISIKNSIIEKAKEESAQMKWRLGISILFLVPLMYVSMHHMIHMWLHIPVPAFVTNYLHGDENAMLFAMTQFLLVLPILYMNRKFFAVGFKTLRHFSPNMDSLIAVGASAAMGYGIFAMYRIAYGMGHGVPELVSHYGNDLYFESAGTILTLITVGKYLESRSKGKTSEAITKLMDLSPKVAIRLTAEGTEEEVSTEALRAGDIFLVKPGSLVPVDGTILEGTSSVDEAAITGESIPVEKKAGDKVVSATVNKAGFLKCRADRVGEDTTLAQIIRLVEEASASKAPIAQLADKVAGVFVPAVMGIAFVTLVGWLLAGATAEFAISTAIAVLVISCPCALGLATPVAIMVGTGVGAKNGILIKSGEALQQARDVDTVVLDKTGTITEGKLTVMAINSYVSGLSTKSILTAAAALEQKSEHPLAEAIIKETKIQGCAVPEATEFQAVFGRGITGVVAAEVCGEDCCESVAVEGATGEISKTDGPTAQIGSGSKTASVKIPAGSRIYVGNLAYMEDLGIWKRGQEPFESAVNSFAEEGQTPLVVADENRILGIIGVADSVKKSSALAIEQWQKMHVDVVMLTGDHKKTAEAVKNQLGLTQVIAEVLPEDKEKEIQKLRAAGRKVAMIGDGINDAPALAAADVGMAIGAGTDVAIESADIVLMKSDLQDAVTAMRLSRLVIRNIKQNLFWAFFYNCVGIPLAAGLLYPAFGLRLNPMFGAAAMSLSSIFVVSNALRLRGFRSEKKVAVSETEPETIENQLTEDQGGKNMKKVIKVEGMMCNHCTAHVQKALEGVAGVASVEMSLENKTATVELEGEIEDETLKAAVVEAGYEVTGIE